MAISLEKARAFIYGHATLWERALFSYLFDGGPLERVHQTLRCYRNLDGGWGHGLEHDVKTPDSHPLALEFLLRVLVDTGVPPGDLLDGAAAWVVNNTAADGSLENPASLHAYPHAPWWAESGQTQPDSITGNLVRLERSSAALDASTWRWVEQNLTLEKIRANEWLFMAYHAFDYFMNVSDFPDLEQHQMATVENIVACAEKAPPKQYGALFVFAPGPDSRVGQAVPAEMLTRFVDHLAGSQQEEGYWPDEHGLPQWYAYSTIMALLTLRRFGRWDGG